MSDAQKVVEALKTFRAAKAFTGKGPLCVALVVTDHARKRGLPLSSELLLTQKGTGGQVAGLGKGAVQKILARYNIGRVLAREGGRTSRGSISNMRDYVTFLNELHKAGPVDLNAVEGFWIESVHAYFAAKPFKLKLDPACSLRSMIRDLLAQAEDRQRESSGVYYAGAVLQHLVGAKLECALGSDQFKQNSYTTSDMQSGRAGDFVVGDAVIHVTTSPGEAVIERCRDNLNQGLRPILVTLQRGLLVAEGLAENAQLVERIDLFEIEQFIALNVYELGRFAARGRETAISDLVKSYNRTIDEFETDPSLRIELVN